ncbi:hypothetical protein CLV24_102201 [Pontibacter ummariensis]|uniref:Uncharacterized protein n=1 Tax=Pontibacter ummariensis TaxID=1610492 RepID=A0A239BXU4_9BACT|nr:hypothetical protein [Pontibacter ummariensis]PRY15579.1 hypothetical protein CLV24_102201 [Pontibacter ummariensis]SNS12251.1 hypothetical protein SAMN06296052_102211 [Pontibacter ummariensis]
MLQRYKTNCTKKRPNGWALGRHSLILFLAGLCAGCASIRESPKYQFATGDYRVNTPGATAVQAYVDVKEDSVVVYPFNKQRDALTERLDTAHRVVLHTTEEVEQVKGERYAYTFSKWSFDIDVLTIPFKFRPGEEGFPQQLTTTFQGAVYVGGRKDIFLLKYKPTPVPDYHKSFNHFGYSVGWFTGIGATTMNEFVTRGAVPYEYEGMVLLNGVAGIVGLNNFTLGLAIGIDHLFDQNREHWIYQHEPWVGLAFGLNLN